MQNNFLLFLGVCGYQVEYNQTIPLVTAKFSKVLSLRPPEGIHVQGPAERPRTSCLLLSNNDQLQAD